MSDEERLLHTFTVDGDWRMYAAYIRMTIPTIDPHTGLWSKDENAPMMYQPIPARGSIYQLNSYRLNVTFRTRTENLGLGTILIDGTDGECGITILGTHRQQRFWDQVVAQIQLFAEQYANVQRTSLTQQFERILDVYYERKHQGMKVKLADMAREANVNYDSLRQAKVRYDRRMKEAREFG